jgi:predicted metal-dependent enzyme (double-stranded beta helix superfamily)
MDDTSLLKAWGLTRSSNGDYWYRPITPPDFPVEIVLFLWSPGAKSIIHDHGAAESWTWVLPIGQEIQLLNTLFRVDNSEIQALQSALLTANAFARIPAHQPHQISNPSESYCWSIHAYFGHRG